MGIVFFFCGNGRKRCQFIRMKIWYNKSFVVYVEVFSGVLMSRGDLRFCCAVWALKR